MNTKLNSMECLPIIKSNKYLYNNKVVPRVTEILSAMLHEDYLLSWSNHLGFKRQSYTDTLKNYAYVGTQVHEAIENFLLTGSVNYISSNNENCIQINNALFSFIEWYKTIHKSNKVKILGIEDTLTCEWFGGTCDLLISINNRTFLVDFKTSKNITYKHFLQLAAYKYMYNINDIHIDGVIILQLNKQNIYFNEILLMCDNDEHMEFINDCTETFLGLVYSYFNRLNVEEKYKNIFK